MATTQFTIGDLEAILLAAAGDEGIELSASLDVLFEELGYDSLALLEVSSRIEREYHISLDDTPVTDMDTPRMLIEAVNSRLTATA
ncbi:acyl carrier protein [Streptomyces sclerotialus]|uniref:acyl carrier protein n=1 Tax=Streptomyces sclerotialus TaxID=1957 RepID=UPI0004C55807